VKREKAAPSTGLIARRLPWHDDVWSRLSALRAAGRLPHALLLRGPGGVGKAGFAAWFANAMLCATPAADGAACGQCRACVQFHAGSHPDYRIGQPEEDKKLIRVDQVRGLIDWLVQRPHYQRGRKLLLIPEAERLNPSAANALLKTLEEPPADTLIILASARPASLLATVRSRCQTLIIPMPPAAQALAWVSEQVQQEQLQQGAPSDALALCGGAPLTALQALRDDQVQPFLQLLAQIKGIARGELDPIDVAAQWHKKDLEWLLNWMLGSVQAMIHSTAAEATSASASLLSVDLAADLKALAVTQAPTSLFEHLDRLVGALRHLHAGQNPSPQLLMESLFIPWQQPVTRSRGSTG